MCFDTALVSDDKHQKEEALLGPNYNKNQYNEMSSTKHGLIPIFKQTSHDGNLTISNPREENLIGVTPETLLTSETMVTEEEDQIFTENTQAELLRWNYHLGHF